MPKLKYPNLRWTTERIFNTNATSLPATWLRQSSAIALGRLTAHLQKMESCHLTSHITKWDFSSICPSPVPGKKRGTRSEHTFFLPTHTTLCQATRNRGYPRGTFRKTLESREPSVSNTAGHVEMAVHDKGNSSAFCEQHRQHRVDIKQHN